MKRSHVAALLAALLVCAPTAWSQAAPVDHAGLDMAGMEGMDHSAQGHGEMDMGMGQMSMLGDYDMRREASGTAWQPDQSPHEGWMAMRADGWMTMLHGDLTLVADHQSGHRGDDKAFVSGMVMGMAGRDVGPGRLTLKLMISPDPFMGKGGYPRLFQTGETADGVHPLVDRQHPHDAIGELAVAYSVNVSRKMSAFVYAGYPGEPALGPAAYLHRGSGMQAPVAPISHHWLDSTHVAFGVVTVGGIWGGVKLETSRFTGREPDQHRWDFDSARFDSSSVRLTFNPSDEWSMQVSRGWIKSPEQLEPDINQVRTTGSVSWSHPFAEGLWQTTIAYGHNALSDGRRTDAALVESSVNVGDHVVFMRWEEAEKDELFPRASPLAGPAYRVSEISGGYVRYFGLVPHLKLGLGGMAGLYHGPSPLTAVYGANPFEAVLFVRLKLK